MTILCDSMDIDQQENSVMDEVTVHNSKDLCKSPDEEVNPEHSTSIGNDTSESKPSSLPPFQIGERVFFFCCTFCNETIDSKEEVSRNEGKDTHASDNDGSLKDVCSHDFEYFEAVVRNVSQFSFSDDKDNTEYIHNHMDGMTSTNKGSIPNHSCGVSEGGSWAVLIHFIGWDSRFDRWVDCSTIHKETHELRKKFQQQTKQRSLASINSTSNNSGKKRGTNKSNNNIKSSNNRSSKRGKGGKGGNSSSDMNYIDGSGEQLHKEYIYSDFCELPLTLKIVLADEHERISRKGWISPHYHDDPRHTNLFRKPPRLVHVLPANVTIRKVLDHFGKKKIKEMKKDIAQLKNSETIGHDEAKSSDRPQHHSRLFQLTPSHIKEFCDGLIELFEAALPKCLLYPQELPQFNYLHRKLRQQQQRKEMTMKQTTNNADPNPPKSELVDIYGCEFLLRLYLRLPALLQPAAETALQFTPISSTSHAVAQPTSTSDGTITEIPILHDVQVYGTLLNELLVLMQKNRPTLFKVSGSYRSPIQGKEWSDWEERVYGIQRNGEKKDIHGLG